METRVSLIDFPVPAQTIIQELPAKCKRFRYYKETDGAKTSFELKFKYKHRSYSLEFSEEGIVEDLEVLIGFKAINPKISNVIRSYFTANFKTYKLIKIQQQYTNTSEVNSKVFLLNVLETNINLLPFFEIIAAVKSDTQRSVREFIFNENGTFLSSRILNATSYEHVLY